MTGSAPALIETIVIAGGGIAGWTAATALSAALPACQIIVVEPASQILPPADVSSVSTAPTITEFLARVRINEAQLMRATAATFKLGTRLTDWHSRGHAYVDGYGEHGAAIKGTAFHQQWLRLQDLNAVNPISRYSVAATAGAERRFAHPAPGSSLAYDYALHLDPVAYVDFLRQHALARGVVRHASAIAAVRAADERIERIDLVGSTSLTADLFIDCTGPEAALIGGVLGVDFEDWSEWLPCDRMVVANAVCETDPAPLTEAIATKAGWQWRVPLADRTSVGHVYSSHYLSDSAAASLLGKRTATRTLPLRQGRRSQQWIGNCLALGDAAITLDPLQATSFHLVQSALQRLLALLPGRDFPKVEIAEFNRMAAREAEGVRDFLQLHYRTSAREDSLFWRNSRSLPVSDNLARKLSLFASRGRIVLDDEETFPKDSWLAVMLGQGILPRSRDRLAAQVDLDDAATALASLGNGVRQAVSKLPPHAAYLAAMRGAQR